MKDKNACFLSKDRKQENLLRYGHIAGDYVDKGYFVALRAPEVAPRKRGNINRAAGNIEAKQKPIAGFPSWNMQIRAKRQQLSRPNHLQSAAATPPQGA